MSCQGFPLPGEGFVSAGRLSAPRPRVLLGDFNDLPGSRKHRVLSDFFHDVFASVGEGHGGTPPLGRFLPSVRIDYIFTSPQVQPWRARVVRTDASDHHILAAEIGLALAPARAAAAG
jgi:endonuclease/exonuclease/phosphatase family metal-dependent hydrolase